MSSKKNKSISAPEGVLKVIPLGGIEEIGKNMTAFEYGNDIIVVDMGSKFADENLPGVDLVIPDVTYLKENADRVRGYFVTHGHEDHIGAAPYILKEVNAPVYATRITGALIENKLREFRMTSMLELNEVEPGDMIVTGVFAVEFISVAHSIAGACALAIHTPVGVVVHTGDYKFDFTPVRDNRTDIHRLAALGEAGVRLMLSDSTNVERSGYTMSEKKVGDTFRSYFEKAQGRIFVAMFASNVSRIQTVIDEAVRVNRKVCIVGRSMVNIAKISEKLGYLSIPEKTQVTLEDVERYRDEELVILTTGSQGEPMSGLSRIAFSEHNKVGIRPTDTVIVSSTPIPGNEKSVSGVIDRLVRSGAEVVYSALADVHASGHACQEELKLMHTLIKPECFVPVHGETRHLYQHTLLARQLGENPDNIIIPQIGGVIEVTANSIRRAGTVPSGNVLVDGLGIGDVGDSVLRDRKHLAEDGMMIIVLNFDRDTGFLVSGPDIITRGVVYVKNNEELIEGAKNVVNRVLDDRMYDTTFALKEAIREAVKRYINESIRRDPMIITIIA